MPPLSVPQVGGRIREARLKRGLSLRGLARMVGVSASLISQIETGKSRPSVNTLYAISTTLGISVAYLFETDGDARPLPGPASPRALVSHSPAPDASVLDALTAFGGRPRQRVGPLVTPGRRSVLELDCGVAWERLGQVPGTRVDFMLATYTPGGTSSSMGRPMRHDGTEYGYIVSGELRLTLGFEEYRLRPGDSVSFESTIPHLYRNMTGHPAVGVWFVTEHPEGT